LKIAALTVANSAPQPENIPWWGKDILVGGAKYIEYNKNK